MNATADIRDVFADARQVAAGTIETGDYVFTPTGARREVTAVRRRGQVVTFTRSDGAMWTWAADDLVTIVPAARCECGNKLEPGRDGDGATSCTYCQYVPEVPHAWTLGGRGRCSLCGLLGSGDPLNDGECIRPEVAR